jgi:hypothetical protein
VAQKEWELALVTLFVLLMLGVFLPVGRWLLFYCVRPRNAKLSDGLRFEDNHLRYGVLVSILTPQPGTGLLFGLFKRTAHNGLPYNGMVKKVNGSIIHGFEFRPAGARRQGTLVLETPLESANL